MSRKDIIVVAILVNVGVLILLFMSSLKPTTMPQVATVDVSKEAIKIEAPKPIEKEQMLTQTTSVEKVAVVEETTPEDILKPFLSSDLKEIKVRKGDILGKIARRYSVSIEELMRINNLSNHSLRIGQVLYVPMKQEKKEEIANTHLYKVKTGDSPWSIAMRHKMKVNDLLELNGLSESEAKRLKPGNELRVK